MDTIALRQKADADGLLRLSVPVPEPGKTYEVVVVLQPEAADAGAVIPLSDETDALGWPKDFFEKTAGSWVGEFPEQEYGEDAPRTPLD